MKVPGAHRATVAPSRRSQFWLIPNQACPEAGCCLPCCERRRCQHKANAPARIQTQPAVHPPGPAKEPAAGTSGQMTLSSRGWPGVPPQLASLRACPGGVYPQRHHCKPAVLTGAILSPRGHLGLSGDSFGCHKMTTRRGLCSWHLWVAARGAAKRPTTYSTATHNGGLLGPRCQYGHGRETTLGRKRVPRGNHTNWHL